MGWRDTASLRYISIIQQRHETQLCARKVSSYVHMGPETYYVVPIDGVHTCSCFLVWLPAVLQILNLTVCTFMYFTGQQSAFYKMIIQYHFIYVCIISGNKNRLPVHIHISSFPIPKHIFMITYTKIRSLPLLYSYLTAT